VEIDAGVDAALYRLIRSALDDDRVPGLALALVRSGEPTGFAVYGREDVAREDPVSPDTTFGAASITKPVTYMAGLKLVERGMLNLSDPVMRHIPDFAAHHKEETLVLHLYTHTSGMPDMPPNNAEMRRGHAPLERFGDLRCQPIRFAVESNRARRASHAMNS